MERSSFFDAILDEEGNPDIFYLAEDLARYYASFIGNGVFPNPATNLQVVANNDMTVTVKKGAAWINGYFYENTDDLILYIDPADGVLNRVDRIALRLDFLDREIRAAVKQGDFGSNAVAKELQRDADGYELAIADITVNRGIISITQASIIDLRLNKELCGIVHGVVDQVDTTAIFNQFESWYAQTKANYDADMATWTREKKEAFDEWYVTNVTEFTNRFDNWFNSNTTNWDNQFTEWFDDIKGQLEGDIAANLAAQILELQNTKASKEELSVLDEKVSEHFTDYANFKNNIEAIKYVGEKIELKIDGEWIEFKSKDGYPVGNVMGLSIAVGNGETTIKWQDPPNLTIKDSLNNTITISRWESTKLVRKTGSYPVNENDGTVVVNNTVRDRYQTNGYKDTGLVNGTTYYYMLFPVTEEDVITIDSANRVSGTPQAYDDLTGSPGPKKLIAGTMQEGFFGEVSSSELITGDSLASQVGISQGTSQHSTAGWLKLAWKGKILFVAKKPIRHSISWDAINAAKCVYGDSGDKAIAIDGKTYKVKLMKGADDKFNPKQPINGQTGGGNGYNGEINHGSQWNRLICQIHEQAISKSWDYPNNIESNIGKLTHNLGSGNQGMYDDSDLVVKSGDGRLSWCQEMTTSTSNRLSRGYTGVSNSYNNTSSNTNSTYGWRPSLELVP